MENTNNDWAKYLSPENLKDNLIGASLYTSIYESFTDYVVDQIKHFYSSGFDNKGPILGHKYKTEVLT